MFPSILSKSEAHKFQTQQAQSFSSLTFTASHTGICKRACAIHSNSSVRTGKSCQIQTSMSYSVCLMLQVSVISIIFFLFQRWMNVEQSPGFAEQRCPMLFSPLRGWPRSRMDIRTHVTGTQCPMVHCSFIPQAFTCRSVCRSSAMLEESQDVMDSGALSPASARQVTIQRHPTQGFGFIAGSHRPVIVRSVSAG